MRDKDRVRRLEDAGYDETTIAETLKLTLQRARTLMQQPKTKLSFEARAEIYFQHTDRQVSELARLYRTSPEEVSTARARLPKLQRNQPSLEMCEAALAMHGTVADAARHLSCTQDYLRDTVGLRRRKVSRSQVLAMLQTSLTKAKIAELLDISPSTVTKIAKEEGLVKGYKRIEDWDKVLEYANAHSVASAARHYDISRAAIHYQIRKRENDQNS